jgi:hypothetical protein
MLHQSEGQQLGVSSEVMLAAHELTIAVLSSLVAFIVPVAVM